VPGGFEPPLHLREIAESLYLLAGRLDLVVGDERRIAVPRTFVSVPAGVPHTMSVAGTEPVRMLMVLSNPARSIEMFVADRQRVEAVVSVAVGAGAARRADQPVVTDLGELGLEVWVVPLRLRIRTSKPSRAFSGPRQLGVCFHQRRPRVAPRHKQSSASSATNGSGLPLPSVSVAARS
jgi:hypothetical protein